MLAQAAIDTQQARGDEVLNLISRSGDATFVQDFQPSVHKAWARAWHAADRRGQRSPSGAGARWAAAAAHDEQAWYAVNDQVYRLDGKARLHHRDRSW